jgi:hypothetical protein
MKKLSRDEMKKVNGGHRDPNVNGCPSIPQCFTDAHCNPGYYCEPCLNELGSNSNRCRSIISVPLD